jgi:Tfp pilus assembly protein PilF
VVQQPPAPPEPIAKPPPPPPKPAPPAPKGPKALLARAKALLGKGDAATALDLYGRVASDDPENVEAQVGRGLCYLDLEKWAPAEASFQAALRLDPDQADALLGLAETHRYEGKTAEAISGYERYLARHPDGEDAEVAKNALAQLRK